MSICEQNKADAIEEFRFIVEKYIFPLFDLTGIQNIIDCEDSNEELITMTQQGEKGYFELKIFPFISKKKNNPTVTRFCYAAKTYSEPSLKRRASMILQELLRISEYNYITYKKKHDYAGNLTYKIRMLDLAFEMGICKWLAPDEKNVTVLHAAISHMINWTSRTYEGKNVPFGLVIDLGEESGAVNYIDFLQNDNSAVFTDGVFSGMLLDKHGNVISFLTRENTLSNKDNEKCVFAPHQFADIAGYCVEKRVGIIALTNGEILLIKNRSLAFAKRGNGWVAFDWSRVLVGLKPYFELINTDKKEIIRRTKELYCTLLDISFSHTGGCIAFILEGKEKKIENVIKERIDLYSYNGDIPVIDKSNKEKMRVLSYLLSYPDNLLHSYFDVGRILRKEISGLDGAVAISLDGKFYCVGSIIKVEAGSGDGGGRTAAAKKLAKFGVGIKVSEDGYIDAFGYDLNNNQNEKDSHIIRLFSFK